MLFNTPVFLLFFLLVVPLSFLVPARWQNFVLLAASYVFYGFSDPKLVLLLLGVTAAAYLSALGISRRPELRKLWKALGILAPLLLLFNFKYFGFIARLVSSLTGGTAPDLIRNLVLPTGISFYTFQALSYVIDTDRGEIRAEKNPLHLALYLSFFPQLVAGPIERAKDLLPQIRKPRAFDPELAVQGLRTMLLGFFEKIAVADILGIFVNRVWADLSAASGADVLLASFFSVCRSSLISRATAISPAGRPACWASACPSTLTVPIPPHPSANSGAAGTSPSPPGSGTISTFRLAAAGAVFCAGAATC